MEPSTSPVPSTGPDTPPVEFVGYVLASLIMLVGGAFLLGPILNFICGPALVVVCVALTTAVARRRGNGPRSAQSGRRDVRRLGTVSWAAHELESYVIQKHMKVRVRVSYLAILLGCYVPDLVTKIFVFGIHVGPIHIAPQKYPWRYHRGFPGVGFTHSLLFGFLVAFFVLWKWRSREWFLGLIVGTAAHVVTDTCDSIGTMLFFPFTTQHYSNGMWAYAAQQGPNGDGAAYYSSLGGVWDLLWLIIALFNWRVLTRTYFFTQVVPDDPVWGWFRRKFRMTDATLLALYRCYFFYGACRIFAWFAWARWIKPVPLDLSWGGPYWVNKAPSYHFTALSFAVNTVVGVIGLSVTLAALWHFLGRQWWDRAKIIDPSVDDLVAG